MPLEIRELIIKAQIEPNHKRTISEQDLAQLEKAIAERVKAQVVQICRQLIQEEFRKRNER